MNAIWNDIKEQNAAFASSLPFVASYLLFVCSFKLRLLHSWLAFPPLLHRISLAFASLLPHFCLSFACMYELCKILWPIRGQMPISTKKQRYKKQDKLSDLTTNLLSFCLSGVPDTPVLANHRMSASPASSPGTSNGWTTGNNLAFQRLLRCSGWKQEHINKTNIKGQKCSRCQNFHVPFVADCRIFCSIFIAYD